jgi:hypothetical protein
LGPFTTLRRCKGHSFRVKRRLKVVLDEIGGGLTKAWLELPGRSTLSRALLEFEESSQEIRLTAYPADTLTQARAFYTRPEAVARLLLLRDVGWSVDPNFHFGHMEPGFAWTTADAMVEEYAAYWSERISTTGKVRREEWEEFWKNLVQRRFAQSDEKLAFDQSFTNTGRNWAIPRPGLKCFYSWRLPTAERLDERGELAVAVAEQLNVILRALGEKLHSLQGSTQAE